MTQTAAAGGSYGEGALRASGKRLNLHTMPGGRPSDYEGKKTLKKSREYILSCIDTYKLGKVREVNIPTAEGLAQFIGTTRKTLYEWANAHEEFRDMLDELNQEQSKRLINNGLSGHYNSNIAKLILAKHGYKEQIGLSGEGEGDGIKIDVNVNNAITKIYGDSD